MAETDVRIGVLRGRENSFPDAFIAKVNAMSRGVTAEFIHLGGTKLNEPVPYRVILDRMSHEVPYYAVYLKMAALQGAYCINNTFWRSADDKFFGYAAAEKLGINQMVGIAMEAMVLEPLDQNATYEFLGGKSAAQRLEELKQQRVSLQALRQSFKAIYPSLTEAELLAWKEREKIFGEIPAMRWVQQQHSAGAPAGGN